MLNQVKKVLSAGSIFEVSARLGSMLNDRQLVKKQMEVLMNKLAHSEANAINNEFIQLDGYELLVKFIKDANRNSLVSLLDKLKNNHKDSIIILIGDDNGTLPIICSVNGEALKKYRAGDIMRQVAGLLGGSGGGKPDFASGAGKDSSKVKEAIDFVKEFIK